MTAAETGTTTVAPRAVRRGDVAARAAAVRLMADRIRRGMRRLRDRGRPAVEGSQIAPRPEWPGAGPAARRPPCAVRRDGGYRLIHTASVPLGGRTLGQAAFEMCRLGRRFHLDRDARTGSDCLLRRTPGGPVLVSPDPRAGRGPAGEPAAVQVRPAPCMTLRDALAALEASAAPVVAVVDPTRRRLHVAYWRDDGHVGLLSPAGPGAAVPPRGVAVRPTPQPAA